MSNPDTPQYDLVIVYPRSGGASGPWRLISRNDVVTVVEHITTGDTVTWPSPSVTIARY